jgi:hypothetical protein
MKCDSAAIFRLEWSSPRGLDNTIKNQVYDSDTELVQAQNNKTQPYRQHLPTVTLALSTLPYYPNHRTPLRLRRLVPQM